MTIPFLRTKYPAARALGLGATVFLAAAFSVAGATPPASAPGTAPGATPDKDQVEVGDTTKTMKDFVVSGEDKFKVRSEKLLRELFVDVDKPIQELLMESSELSQRLLPDKQLEAYERSGLASESHMTFSPWLNLITKQPILVIKTPKSDLNLKTWKFAIFDETGNLLYAQNGGGRLPDTFAWDGRCQDGHILDVGQSFYYSISLVDSSGNPLFTSSKPRRLSSLAYYHNNNLIINLLSSILFDQKMRSNLSGIGTSLMNESCDYIIKDIGRVTVISVSSSNPSLAQAQGETVRDFIVEKLAIPVDDFKIVVLPSAESLTDGVSIECQR